MPHSKITFLSEEVELNCQELSGMYIEDGWRRGSPGGDSSLPGGHPGPLGRGICSLSMLCDFTSHSPDHLMETRGKLASVKDYAEKD